MGTELIKYPKIENLFERDEETKCMKWGAFREPWMSYLWELEWVATEKIDGTNIRIHWDGENVSILGRTDKSDIPTYLLETLQANEGLSKEKFLEKEMPPMVLFGEGYGAKIQKGGGNYKQNGQDFILFDVWCGDVWLERINVCDVGDRLGIQVIPTISINSLEKLTALATRGFKSWIAVNDYEAEGLVATPSIPLLDRTGRRIIVKLKTKDLRTTKGSPHIG